MKNLFRLIPLILGLQLAAQTVVPTIENPVVAKAGTTTPAGGKRILFIGNSFTSGYKSPVQQFRTNSVINLNINFKGEAPKGGVPALFKSFTEQAGLNYQVSLETVGGKGLDFHLTNKCELLARPWDYVVMHGYSTLDQAKPGDASLLVKSTKQVAELIHEKNPQVEIWLVATWTRADLVYKESSPWFGKPVETMAKDLRAGYNQARAATPLVRGVIPTGEAWSRAMAEKVADPNPYDGIIPGEMDLWAADHYHGSNFGYYLSALMIFGEITGLDPRSLGGKEIAAVELGFTPEQTKALQQVAYEELSANGSQLKTFQPIKP
ncbi:MAG: PEP-CTERM sorting domain-containing protein [Verrucomicrobiota bacterium]